jgi:AbrB family looped-hinge helix DNA binding protein
MTEHYTVVTRKGQITVPAEIRKALGLQIGDRVVLSLDENGQRQAKLRPATSVADSTFGSLLSVQRVADEEDVRQAFSAHAAARDERSKSS